MASGSWTSTSPCLRRRLATPVVHHLRSRCQLRSAACNTHQIVSVLTSGNPSSARRSARCKVDNDHVAVPSRCRSGTRCTSARMRSRSRVLYLALGPPPWRSSTAGNRSRLKRTTKAVTASPSRRPTVRAAPSYEQPAATAKSIRARATATAAALPERLRRSRSARSPRVKGRKGSSRRRVMTSLPGNNTLRLDPHYRHPRQVTH